tara:strand:- start:2308 stop:2421 length:114 start_codon:yes stop_codon:yes gene_type:complete
MDRAMKRIICKAYSEKSKKSWLWRLLTAGDGSVDDDC